MAKLNGVKLVSESITYNGVDYAKSEDKAAKGDIIRFDDDRSYVTEGAYYEVTRLDGADDPQIIDNDGDEYDLCGNDFTVYKALTSAVTPQPPYTEVKRQAAVGERIKIVDATFNGSSYSNGDIGAIKEALAGGVIAIRECDGGRMPLFHSEYVVLEAITQPPVKSPERAQTPALKVGDYAKITSLEGDCLNGFSVGDIVTIVESPYGADDEDYRVTKTSRPDASGYACKNGGLVAANAEEIAAATKPNVEPLKVGDTVKLTIADGKRPNNSYGPSVKNGDIGILKRITGNAVSVDFPNHGGWNGLLTEFTPANAEDDKQASVTAKWAALGRKVGEFKAGDIVRVLTDHPFASKHKAGDIGMVSGPVTYNFEVITARVSDSGGWITPEHVELVAPVESLFSGAVESERTASSL